MATTRQWLNLPNGQNSDAIGVCVMCFGLLKHCQCGKAETLHVLLPAFCIAISQRVANFGGVSSSPG
jgi:hypothetical protein